MWGAPGLMNPCSSRFMINGWMFQVGNSERRDHAVWGALAAYLRRAGDETSAEADGELLTYLAVTVGDDHLGSL